jgi:hypothetical protein
LRNFLKQNTLQIDPADIKRYSSTSDADIPPEAFIPSPLKNVCNRVRSPFKIELRGMVGVRPQTNETIYYPGVNGGTTYERKFIGFGIGGTTIVPGVEVAFLPRVVTVQNKHSFNLGLLTGFWPVDGSSFIPLSLHPRFTLNDITNPLWSGCDAIYFFGDLGTAYDAKGKINFIYDNKLTSNFWGIGLGYDHWLSKNLDISVDLGYRQTNLALPEIQDLSECLELLQIQPSHYSIYPVRSVGMFFIRFGITL